jgi:putative ABC transport system ATP-binding protein
MFLLNRILPNFFNPNPNSEIWGRMVEFKKGRSYRVKAPSGSGKSSLVLFLTGLNAKYTGEIRFQGEELRKLSGKVQSNFLSRQIAVVFQDLRLIPRLNLMENLLLKANLSHWPAEEIIDLLRYFDLEESRYKKVGELSQGEMQRLAIIRCLCQEFEFLLLDEPFSHLDEEWKRKGWDLLKKKQKLSGAGIIYTSLDGDEKWDFDQDFIL